MHTDSIVTPTDTMYVSGLGFESVRSLTIAADHTFSEWYYVRDLTSGNLNKQTDQGSWMLMDSVLALSVANAFPHKLNYRLSTDQLVTDKVNQTALFYPYGFYPSDSVRVAYTVRLFFRRGDP